MTAPWYVAAGWALDLFRGSQSRPHADLEIAVPASRFDEFRTAFAGYEFDVPAKGCLWPSTPELLPFSHQTWLRDPATGTFLVDVFREPHDGDTWICWRDETLRLPYTDIIERTEDGIPYLIPELVLLFKAKKGRPKDLADLEGVLPLLDASRRARLADWLARVHPGHAWLSLLDNALARPPGRSERHVDLGGD